jgi:hypothetical protein
MISTVGVRHEGRNLMTAEWETINGSDILGFQELKFVE